MAKGLNVRGQLNKSGFCARRGCGRRLSRAKEVWKFLDYYYCSCVSGALSNAARLTELEQLVIQTNLEA